MHPTNDEEYSANSQDDLNKLLAQLRIDDNEDTEFRTISQVLGHKIINEDVDDEEDDSETEEYLNADSDNEEDESSLILVSKCPPTNASTIVLEGSDKNLSQAEIVNMLKNKSDKLKDPVQKLKFLTEKVHLNLGYSVSALVYSIFTNKSQIVKFLINEIYHKCVLTLRQVIDHLDQRDKDGNNMLLGMAESPLDLTDTFRVLFSFRHGKYFMVNPWAKNQNGENIWDILKENRSMTKEVKEMLEKTLKELIQNCEFEQSWIGDNLNGANNYDEENTQKAEGSFAKIALEVNDQQPTPTIQKENKPQVSPSPQPDLGVRDGVDGEIDNVLDENAQGILENRYEGGHGLGVDVGVDNALENIDGNVVNNVDGDAVGENVAEENPPPVHNLEQIEPELMWACSMDDCGIVHHTKEEAEQCAHGEEDNANPLEQGVEDDVIAFDIDSLE